MEISAQLGWAHYTQIHVRLVMDSVLGTIKIHTVTHMHSQSPPFRTCFATDYGSNRINHINISIGF